MMFPNNIMRLIFPPIALKAKWFVLIFGLIEFTSGLSGTMGNSGDNVAHFAHLGGMLFGLIIILFWKKNNRLYN
jgi:membrane associated rhomboid family serine protease